MSEKKETNIKENERFISVDSGKFKTKVALLSNDRKHVLKFGFRTMIDEGNFDDDAIEASTFIAEVNGKTYKMGNGASREAILETTKMSEIHKVTTLAAIALVVNDGDVVNVCIGCPVKEYAVVKKRIEYRDYILPKGPVTIKVKTKNETSPKEKTFTIAYSVVYPELAGVLYLDMERFSKKSVGIVDIGGGTGLGCIFNDFEIDAKYAFSSELGGNILSAGLSQKLSSEFSRCTTDYVRKLLTLPHSERKLVPKNGSPEQIEIIGKRSQEIIDDYLENHIREIRRQIDVSHWPVDYLDLVFVGGTSGLLSNELKNVFGQNIYIPENPEYVNAIGFLRRLCATKAGIIIPVDFIENAIGTIQGSNAIA